MENTVRPKFQFQKSEVSMVKWYTLNEAVNNIRTYNLEKIELIKKVDSVLNKYRLIL